MSHSSSTRWRSYLKVGLAAAIGAACRLDQPPVRAPQYRRPLILGYHRVVEDFAAASRTEMPSMLISRGMLERHIEWIGKRFRFVSLDEIGERVTSGRPFAGPVAAITFDDGYSDVYEIAFPLLRRKGIPAAVFVVTDWIDQPLWQTHDKLYCLIDKAFHTWADPARRLREVMTGLRLPTDWIVRGRAVAASSMSAVSTLLTTLPQADVIRLMNSLETDVPHDANEIPRNVTWPMVREMRRGGFTIGSQTRTHVSLPMEVLPAVKEELEGSKRVLEQALGEPSDHFAYPGGQFTPRDVRALHDAGYRYGYTACPHGDPRYPALTLERLLLWEGSSIDADGRFLSSVFNCQIHSRWPPARRCGRLHNPVGRFAREANSNLLRPA
jgi:peptidoglycan/xylan/chitin deacetylase (PgdA/CDA1 family)